MQKQKLKKKENREQGDQNSLQQIFYNLCKFIRQLFNYIFKKSEKKAIPMHEDPPWEESYPKAEFPWYHRLRQVTDWINKCLNPHEHL